MLNAEAFRPDTRVLRMAKSVVSTGYDVTIVAWDRECRYRKTERTASNIFVRRFRLLNCMEFTLGKYLLSMLLFTILSIFYIIQKSRDTQKVVVHCNGIYTLLSGYLLKKILRRPRLVYDVREYDRGVLKPWVPSIILDIMDIFEAKALKEIDLIFTVNNLFTNRYKQMSKQPVITIYNAPEKNLFKKIPDNRIKEEIGLEGKFIVLFAGTIREFVGLRELVEVAQHLKGAGIDNIRFLLVGEGPLKKHIQTVIYEKDVDTMFKQMSWLKFNRLNQVINASDLISCIYTHQDPDNAYALPIKMFEAMSCEKPFITSKTSRLITDIVQRFNCGIICEEDPLSILNAILKLRDDADLRDVLSKNGRLAIEKEYNWELMSCKVKENYPKPARAFLSRSHLNHFSGEVLNLRGLKVEPICTY